MSISSQFILFLYFMCLFNFFLILNDNQSIYLKGGRNSYIIDVFEKNYDLHISYQNITSNMNKFEKKIITRMELAHLENCNDMCMLTSYQTWTSSHQKIKSKWLHKTMGQRNGWMVKKGNGQTKAIWYTCKSGGYNVSSETCLNRTLNKIVSCINQVPM